jgi:ATP-dependent metalloprotease
LQILNLHLQNVPIDKSVKVGVVARGTPGFSGADLANLVNVAAIKASQDDKDVVSMADLEFAKDRIMMGAERKSAVITEESRRLTAYHEGGHAIVACYTDGALPVHKATVVPRGMALGMVMQLPDSDETSWSRKQMLAKMDVCMGGRVAEEVIFGPDKVTSGASSDFEQATSIAMNMVERWGMSEKLGHVAHKHLTGGGRNGGEAAYSEETRQAIDGEVKRLTDEAYSNAKRILKKHEDKLHLLANALIEKETLTGEEVRRILGLAEPVDKAEPQVCGVRRVGGCVCSASCSTLLHVYLSLF